MLVVKPSQEVSIISVHRSSSWRSHWQTSCCGSWLHLMLRTRSLLLLLLLLLLRLRWRRRLLVLLLLLLLLLLFLVPLALFWQGWRPWQRRGWWQCLVRLLSG